MPLRQSCGWVPQSYPFSSTYARLKGSCSFWCVAFEGTWVGFKGKHKTIGKATNKALRFQGSLKDIPLGGGECLWSVFTGNWKAGPLSFWPQADVDGCHGFWGPYFSFVRKGQRLLLALNVLPPSSLGVISKDIRSVMGLGVLFRCPFFWLARPPA